MSEIAEVTNTSFSIWPGNDPGMPDDLVKIKDSVTGRDTMIIRPINRNLIAGYMTMNDIDGNPEFILRVTMSRDVYNQGQVTLLFAAIAIACIGLLGGSLFIYLIRKAVFSRFAVISSSINAIGNTGDVSHRISVGGSDEITYLAENFNNMLDKIGETETQLIAQEKRFDRLLTYSPNAIIVVDDQNNLILVNKAFCSLFNISEGNAIGKNLSSFIPAEEIAVIEPLVSPSEGSVSVTETSMKIGNEDKRFALTIITLSPGEYLLIGRDITREREEQERLFLNDRLASIGEMAAGIAHELNNPLTGIVMLSQLLMQGDFSDDEKNDIKDINSEAIRATDVVRNLLAFARKQPPARRLTQINKIISDVLKLRHYEQSVNNIEVVTKLHPDLPEVFVDNVQIQQAFLNLVLNAEYSMIHAHKKGKLQVESNISGGMIIVSFTDDGEGIKEENLKKLFQPFFTTKEVGVGTGLGLSLCYGIIHRHGGAIYATSKYGSWATFTVELPIDEPDSDDPGIKDE
jgi:PAS domain S-box-containing protein